MLSVANNPFMLSVIMLSVFMLSVANKPFYAECRNANAEKYVERRYA
jgi:hypothetical protein